MTDKPSKKTTFDQIDLAQLAKKHDERGTQAQAFDMHIDAMGQWYHQGDMIKRPPLVKLFASVLTRLDDGQYWLITPAERGVITVEDAPFYVVKMDVEDEGQSQQITLTTSLDDTVTLGKDHGLRVETQDDGQPRPYVNIRGGLDALLARSVYYELAELAVEHQDRFGIWSGDVFHPMD